MFFEQFGDICNIERSLNMNYSMVRPVSDRAYWDKIKEAGKDAVLSYLDSVKGFHYMLPATLYMEFSRNGNRTNYEAVQFTRLRTLMAHTLLEAMDNDGSHMDDVTDFVWMMLEQTTWCFPAHKYLTPESDALLSTERHTLDLFQAEAGCILSFVYALLKDKLDGVSKFIAPRIVKEIKARVVDNFMERSDYWWQGFDESRKVNNWNPWILSNVLLAASAVEEDRARLARIVEKAMVCLDKYVKVYPEDGACDEGPSYWNRAGLSLLDCADFLHGLTNGYVNVWENTKIRNTAEYITKIQIGNSYVVNFADCSGRISGRSYGTHLKYAKILNSSALESLARELKKRDEKPDFTDVYTPPRVMDYLEAWAFEADSTAKSVYAKDTYFDSVQVAISRESEDLSGLFLAVKGGHNEESHNHNDIGNIIVYKNQKPFIIDAGNETYCAKTFSPERYEIWANQSGFHNVPKIAGSEQCQGREYCAENVEYAVTCDGMHISMELKNAYENCGQIEHFTRKIVFSRTDKSIILTDDYALSASGICSWTFLTPCTVEKTADGILLTAPDGEAVQIQTDLAALDAVWEPVDTEDALILKAWGKAPTRITFTQKQEQTKGKIVFSIV